MATTTTINLRLTGKDALYFPLKTFVRMRDTVSGTTYAGTAYVDGDGGATILAVPFAPPVAYYVEISPTGTGSWTLVDVTTVSAYPFSASAGTLTLTGPKLAPFTLVNATDEFFALNPASGPYGATTGVTVGPTWINAQSEGADMSGATFSDTALANAYANKIPSGGGGIFFPPGTPKFNGQQAWNTKAIFLRGSGRDITTLNFPTALGAGVPGIILTSAINLRTSQAENFTIKGAGITPLGGPKQGYGDGIRVDNPMLLRDIRAIRFDDGIVFNSPNGHITLEDVEATQNYYGVYDIVGTGDMFITDSDIGGNLFAGIACPGNLTLDHYSLIRTHLGFCPYGIYHEVNGAAMGFMNDCELIGARFEATGNVAIYDPNFAQAAAGFSGNTIINPGHSFSNTYKIAANPQDYAIKIGQIQGPQNFLIQGTSGFMAGSSGTIFVQALNGGLLIFGDNNVQLVTVGSGNKGFAGRWTRYGNIYANGIDATDTGIFKVGDTIATAVLLAKSNPGTGATTGFPYIPASAGAPTGVAGAQSGFVPMYYDTTNHKLWIYDGGWKGVVVA